MNFLIIVYKGIGDVVLTTPLINAIKKFFPESSVYFLTKKYSSEILKNNPLIEKVLIREELKISELRKLKIDVSIDYMLSSSSAFYSVISGAKKRIAFYRNWGFLAYNTMIKSEYEGYNVIKKFQYLKPFGIDWKKIEDIKPKVYYTEGDRKKVLDIFKKVNVNTDKIITLDITSPRAYRQLSADKFMYITDRLIEKGYIPFFCPARCEYEYVKNSVNTYSKYKEKCIIVENLSLLEMACVISYSKLHIGTSSAPMHIAVAFDVPTFTIYSPYTDPKAWTPPNEIHYSIQGEFDKLTAQEIYQKLEHFLSQKLLKAQSH